jgi:transcriptional regulator with XRE-family HTH domain
MPLRTDGAAIRDRREHKNLTLTRFAELTGYTLNHVSQIELGNSNGGPRYLREAARVLDCEIEDITNGTIPRARHRRRRTPAGAQAPESAA